MDRRVLQAREAISALFMLTDCPKAIHPTEVIQPSEAESVVSIATERQIVENFTFLSSTTTDPLKVRALCLELPGKGKDGKASLKIASNHGELKTVKNGLECIIAQLKDNLHIDSPVSLTLPTVHASEGATSRLDALLHSIVTLNFGRILCRLQSKHARWQGNFRKMKARRVPIPKQFLDALTSGRTSLATNLQVERIIQTLTVIFNLLERGPSPKMPPDTSSVTLLSNIVRCVYCLWRTSDCRTVISRPVLWKQISKIARYVTVMFSLVEQRSKFSWIGSLRVEPVKLEPLMLPMLPKNYGKIKESVSQLSVPANIVQQLPGRVRSLEGHKGKSPDVMFVDLVKIKCAVHAEIQLVFHYELCRKSTLPRVILATKSPCFLCTLFLTLHGQYHIPTSHGRLYEKWTFPQALRSLESFNMLRMTETVDVFLKILAQHIVRAVMSPQAGQIASSESLFRKSFLWLSLSRAPSLMRLRLCDSKDQGLDEKLLDDHKAVLRWIRCSTAMLVAADTDPIYINRGRRIVFNLAERQTSQVAVQTKHLRLRFIRDQGDNSPQKTDKPQSRLPNFVLVKVRHLSSLESSDDVETTSARRVVDIESLKPGEEVIMDQDRPEYNEFSLKDQKGEYLYVQIRNPTLDRR